MSERRKWPTWVTQTLKEEALFTTLPLWGGLMWALATVWVLAILEVITFQQALYINLAMALVFSPQLLYWEFDIQREEQCRLLHASGEREAQKRSLSVRHHLDWKWFAFGAFFILRHYLLNPKRPAD